MSGGTADLTYNHLETTVMERKEIFFLPDVEKSDNAVHKLLFFFSCWKEVFVLPVDKADVLNRSPHLEKGPRCPIRAELLMRWS